MSKENITYATIPTAKDAIIQHLQKQETLEDVKNEIKRIAKNIEKIEVFIKENN